MLFPCVKFLFVLFFRFLQLWGKGDSFEVFNTYHMSFFGDSGVVLPFVICLDMILKYCLCKNPKKLFWRRRIGINSAETEAHGSSYLIEPQSILSDLQIYIPNNKEETLIIYYYRSSSSSHNHLRGTICTSIRSFSIKVPKTIICYIFKLF